MFFLLLEIVVAMLRHVWNYQMKLTKQINILKLVNLVKLMKLVNLVKHV